MSIQRRILGALILSWLAVGCGERPPERRSLEARAVFVAMERDFAGFRRWGSLDLPESKIASATHPAGKQRAYVNALPLEGSRAFPVGTMIVKQVEGGDEQAEQLFAMAKRGGGFNADGAREWEWFELKERGDGSVGVAWRGLGAPSGEEYGGDPLGTCNSCHQMAIANDYVKSAALALK